MWKDIDTRGFYYIEQNRYYRDYITLCEIYFKFLYFDWKRQPVCWKFCTVFVGMISGVIVVILVDFVEARMEWFALPALDFLFLPLHLENAIKN